MTSMLNNHHQHKINTVCSMGKMHKLDDQQTNQLTD